MFCKHDWKLISETITEAKINLLTQTPGISKASNIPKEFFERKVIQNLTCTKCGKLKHFVEVI